VVISSTLIVNGTITVGGSGRLFATNSVIYAGKEILNDKGVIVASKVSFETPLFHSTGVFFVEDFTMSGFLFVINNTPTTVTVTGDFLLEGWISLDVLSGRDDFDTLKIEGDLFVIPYKNDSIVINLVSLSAISRSVALLSARSANDSINVLLNGGVTASTKPNPTRFFNPNCFSNQRYVMVVETSGQVRVDDYFPETFEVGRCQTDAANSFSILFDGVSCNSAASSSSSSAGSTSSDAIAIVSGVASIDGTTVPYLYLVFGAVGVVLLVAVGVSVTLICIKRKREVDAY
jgi:hypothetical protein